MDSPKKTVLSVGCLVALVVAFEYVPSLSNYRLMDWDAVSQVGDFRPSIVAPLDPIAAAEVKLKPGRALEKIGARMAVEPLSDPSGSLVSFYNAIERLEAGEVGATVRLAHYGDSPTTADLITADVRSLLQKRFGDAGHGYYLIAKPWAWYGHRGVDSDSSGWDVEASNLTKNRDGFYGYGGVSFKGGAGARASSRWCGRRACSPASSTAAACPAPEGEAAEGRRYRSRQPLLTLRVPRLKRDGVAIHRYAAEYPRKSVPLMKTRAVAAALLLAFTSVSVPVVSYAQADDPLTVQARSRFKEGVEAYDKGQYEAARASFLQAYALKNHPAVLLNLAQSCLRANHPLEAIKYFQQYLRQAQSPTPQQRHDAEAGLEEARGKVGHVDIQAPAGTEVSIVGGDRLGNAPFGEGVDLDPGSYTFKSRATDGSSDTAKVTVVAGQRAQVKFGQAGGPTPVPTPVPTPTPTTNVPATPDPTPTPDPSAGNGGPKVDKGVETPSKPTNLLSPPKTLVPVAIGGAVTIVGVVGAIYFVIAKGNAQSSADSVDATIRGTAKQRGLNPIGICSSTAKGASDFAGACSTYKSDLDQVNQDATAANISAVLIPAGILFAAGWYLFAPKKDDPAAPATSSLNVTPIVGIGAHGPSGLSVSGSF